MNFNNFFNKIIGFLTHYYNFGKNNKIIFTKKGRIKKRIFMPKGLTVVFGGNNNVITIEEPIHFENVLINLEDNNGIFSLKHSKFKVRDARFYVENNSQILIGSNCQLKSRNLVMIANGSFREPAIINIGNNVFIGQNATIRTSDGHTIIDPETGIPLNETANIIIEDNVWITSNCTILKGSHIPSGSIVGACSLVNKKFEEKNTIIAGLPAKIIKHNITWDPRGYGSYSQKYYRQIKKAAL